MTDRNLSEKEAGQRIVAGMSLVHDLFNEVHALIRLIVQGLDASDADVRCYPGKKFALPVGKSSTAADMFLTTDMGLYADIGASDNDIGDEEEDLDGGETDSDQRQAAITPSSQFLGVRAILFDPSSAKRSDEFSPCVVAAVFSNLKRSPAGKKAKQQMEQSTFDVKRAKLKLLAKQCSTSLVAGNQISCRLTGARLGATVLSVASKPLASFNSEATVNDFVAELVEMIDNALDTNAVT